MPRYPHTKLFSIPRRIVVLSGPHIQVLDTQTGRVLFSTANLAQGSEDEEVIVRSGPIRCSGLSKDGRYLATTGDDKRLKIWDLESLTLLNTRVLPKKPTSIEFSGNADILVSDKFGDVFRYALHPNDKPGKSTCDTLASRENISSGEHVLGHASLITSCLLTPDERFIITADRDEHIRVSWYPEGYVIETYCLGHKKYVSAIHIPAASPTSLISGGGDPELKIWDWMTGYMQRNVMVFAAVEPFIRVTAQNRTPESPDENSDDEEAIRSGGGKENERQEKQRNISSLEPEGSEGHRSSKVSNKMFSATETVFVVRRISSFLSEGENHVVFSVVGATAIFEFILAETHDQPEIRHHDFGKPVIDFTVCGEGTIWVLLDADLPEESNVTDACPRKLVQAVRWSVDQFANAGNSMLLDSLNTICSLPVTAEDLKALDLYSDLSSLPKSIDREYGSQGLGRPEPIRQPLDDEPIGESASVAVGLTKRARGRLKHKRALDQLRHEKVGGHDVSGPDTKKMRASSGNEDSHSMYSESNMNP